MAAAPTTNISFQNFFSATLTATLSSSGVDVFLDTVPNGTEGFLVIDPDSATNREIIYYTSKTASKVTCPSVADGRGQDDTTATSHEIGTLVIMAPIAAYYETLLSLFQTTPQGYTSLTGTFTAPVCNGNRSYTMTTSADQTAVLSPGARIRTTRTVTAPTQCTSLNGTTQYYSKTAPAGMTFTDDFAMGGWVKLSSYPTGSGGVIISRYDVAGANGFALRILSDGRVQIGANNAGAGNYRGAQTYQSLPLNKWVHVAAQMDMSAFTATTTTMYIMIDGVDVPIATIQGGTNPTTLVQGGNLEVGSQGVGQQLLPGKIAQAFVTSAKVPQATIRSNYMNQSISPTETSLISAYSFNNTINDLNTTNANNLTANGSAVATNADSPFTQNGSGTPTGTYDYAIVTALTSSTLTVQVPEGCTIPTVGGISAVVYSSNKVPYGFPSSRGRWAIELIIRVNETMGIGGVTNWSTAASLNSISIPIGNWQYGFDGAFYAQSTVSGARDFAFALAPVPPTATPASYPSGRLSSPTSTTVALASVSSKRDTSLAAATVYRFYGYLYVATGSETWVINASQTECRVYADLADL